MNSKKGKRKIKSRENDESYVYSKHGPLTCRWYMIWQRKSRKSQESHGLCTISPQNPPEPRNGSRHMTLGISFGTIGHQSTAAVEIPGHIRSDSFSYSDIESLPKVDINTNLVKNSQTH